MKFAFPVHKRKSRMIGQLFQQGAKALGYECRLMPVDGMPHPDETYVTYGVTPPMHPAWRAAKDRIALDNGWLSTERMPTIRWVWNGMQAHRASLSADKATSVRLGWWPLPHPRPRSTAALRRCMVVLSSPMFYDYAGLPYTEASFVSDMTDLLTERGWKVVIRRKPAVRRGITEPPLMDQLREVGAVVSLCSAVNLRALADGIPAYHVMDTPLCCPKVSTIGSPGEHGPVSDEWLRRTIFNVAWSEATHDDIRSGAALKRILQTPPAFRKGFLWPSLSIPATSKVSTCLRTKSTSPT